MLQIHNAKQISIYQLKFILHRQFALLRTEIALLHNEKKIHFLSIASIFSCWDTSRAGALWCVFSSTGGVHLLLHLHGGVA